MCRVRTDSDAPKWNTCETFDPNEDVHHTSETARRVGWSQLARFQKQVDLPQLEGGRPLSHPVSNGMQFHGHRSITDIHGSIWCEAGLCPACREEMGHGRQHETHLAVVCVVHRVGKGAPRTSASWITSTNQLVTILFRKKVGSVVWGPVHGLL
jgi:hypothetical protein